MIRSYLCRPDGLVSSGLSEKQIRSALRDPKSLLWLDIENPEDEQIELLLEVFGLHPLTMEDVILPNSRPKLEEFDDYLFLVMHGLRHSSEEGPMPVELDICIGKNFLITVRGEAMDSLEQVCVRVERRGQVLKQGPDFLLHAIVDALIDSYFPVLERIEDQVDELEAKLFQESSEDVLKELFRVYSELMVLRRTLAPHREILSRMHKGDLPFLTRANQHHFRDIYDHLLRMSDLADSCREVTTMSLEAYATIVSNRQNQIMKTMTAIATLALPLVIVTGIFGMNFHENPELGPRWIYQVLSGTLVLSIPLMALYFRRNKWL